MHWYKAQVRPYEPPPAETPVDVVNNPVRQVTKAEMDWDYAGRDKDGEKIYAPIIFVTYKDGERFQEQVFRSHSNTSMDQLIKEYNDWCQEQGLVPVPPTSQDYKADMQQMHNDWEDSDRDLAEAEDDRRFEEEMDAAEGRLERGEKPIIPRR
jgi:hypothetical protein